ncbi:MAG TPA: hypothetical protein VKH41_02270 [Myxococcota bacterium]|nr:hypothetical protein [Myxococcota bacterium]
MITGANTNVRYRGILFHVQTEDSGRANPHIISHVYHGGTILGTHKTDYSDRLEADDLASVVRGLIDEQHAAMLAKLHSGGFDAVIAQRLGKSALDADTAAGPQVPSRPDTDPETRSRSSGPDIAPRRAAAARPIAAAPLPKVRRGERSFGEGLGSQKPLDEVILDYLAEKARERAPERTASTAARKSRPSG